MKKNILIVLLLLCNTVISAQADNLTIKGRLENFKKGRLLLLARSGEEKTDTLGHCTIKKGKFELQADIKEPMVTQIILEGYSGGFTLLAEPGTTYDAYLSENDNYYIKGGKLNDSYTAHMRASDSLRTVISALQAQYDSLRAGMKFRSASRVNSTLQQEQKKLKEMTDTFLNNNDNLISAYTIYSNIDMRDAGLQEAKRMYNTLGEGAKATQYGRMIKERISRMEKTIGGAKAPDFTLNDLNGNPITMSAIKGKIKIIDFWASWCGPCRLNNPALKKLYDEFHDKGLEIVGVSLDTKKEAWENAVKKDGLNWINVSSLKGWKCEVTNLYNVKGVPALFILDENNQIIATGLRGEQLKTFLKENLE